MHYLKGIVVPLAECKTKKEAIVSAESYAEDQCDTFWDYYQTAKETKDSWDLKDSVIRSDTEKGRFWLKNEKAFWLKQQNEYLNRARKILNEKTNDELVEDWFERYKLSERAGPDSPIWGSGIGYVDVPKDFDMEPSWIVFIDFHC